MSCKAANPIQFWNEKIRGIAKTLSTEQARELAELFGELWTQNTALRIRAEKAEAELNQLKDKQLEIFEILTR